MSGSIKLLILIVLLAAGCSSRSVGTTTGTPGKATRTAVPIPSAMPWTPVAAPLSAENVTRISVVGSLPGHSASINSYAFGHQKPLLATRDGSGMVFVWDLQSGKIVQKINIGSGINQAFFSPDDSKIITTGADGQIRVFNALSGQQESAISGDSVRIVSAVATSDGGALYFIGAGGAVSGWRPAMGRGASFVIPPVKNTHPVNLAVSPDGKLLAVIQEYSAVTLYDAITGVKIRESKLFPEIVQNILFSPNGATLVIGTAQTIYTLNVSDLSESHRLYDVLQSADNSMTISPDSRMLAVNGKDFVFVWSLDGGFQMARLPEHPDGASGIVWSPDGKLLATIGYGKRGGAYLWDVTSFTANTNKFRQGKVAKGEDEMFNAAWSPDGKLLIASNIYGTMFVWGSIPR